MKLPSVPLLLISGYRPTHPLHSLLRDHMGVFVIELHESLICIDNGVVSGNTTLPYRTFNVTLMIFWGSVWVVIKVFTASWTSCRGSLTEKHCLDSNRLRQSCVNTGRAKR